ncbi:SRPBCC domain-containing protein [Pseudooceanicola sp. HF7]|uniref:SRPBCC family protein n=1 Tax=Pseudooceanicola sp. HF7 TaxID=2721560 RepID=UPI001431A667|nr:SRPBCC domain-containing protein [Pseudooceanicola sp. HF7]NIZ10512.1 SRPBCC domain-containing protein [Pseudooceanicola sp. HF7]
MKDSESHDLELVRDYPVTLDRLWRAGTEPLQVVQWFGPEGVYIQACDMAFQSIGPWSCTMVGKESGQRFKLSGVVTSVSPPEHGKSDGDKGDDGRGHVGFTWAWHDPQDQRGPESHVIFTVEATETGARLRLSHRGLPSLEAAQDHSRGWLSTLRKMDYFLCSPGVLAN